MKAQSLINILEKRPQNDVNFIMVNKYGEREVNVVLFEFDEKNKQIIFEVIDK